MNESSQFVQQVRFLSTDANRIGRVDLWRRKSLERVEFTVEKADCFGKTLMLQMKVSELYSAGIALFQNFKHVFQEMLFFQGGGHDPIPIV